MQDSPPPKDTGPKDLLEWLGLRDDPNWKVARPLGVIIGVVLFLLFALALAAAVVTLGKSFVTTAANPAGGLGTGALIVALLGAPFLIWNTVIKHKALGFQKEGHLTDRLSKAVEQLGVEKTVKLAGVETTRPNIEVRIGAILLLERIAQDSTIYDKGRDHVRVMEILCAYLRENATASGAKDFPLGDWEPLKDDPTDEERATHEAYRSVRFAPIGYGNAQNWAQTLAAPRADIALALRVIGRRDDDQRKVEATWPDPPTTKTKWVFDRPCPPPPDRVGINPPPLPVAELKAYMQKLEEWKTRIDSYGGYRLDLRATNLQRADLSGLNLAGARLTEARMEGADLRQARMEGANLSGARMEGAYLSLARMEGADLRRARMQGAFLIQAQMQGADLGSAQMQGTNLGSAQMQGANLSWAGLEGAFLNWAGLEGAFLIAARMQGANLGSAQMQGADLRRAWMDADTQLYGAKLRGAGLRDQDWSTVPITPGQTDGTFGDGSVILPPGLTRPAHWPQGILDPADFDAAWRKWQSDPAAYTPPAP